MSNVDCRSTSLQIPSRCLIHSLNSEPNRTLTSLLQPQFCWFNRHPSKLNLGTQLHIHLVFILYPTITFFELELPSWSSNWSTETSSSLRKHKDSSLCNHKELVSAITHVQSLLPPPLPYSMHVTIISCFLWQRTIPIHFVKDSFFLPLYGTINPYVTQFHRYDTHEGFSAKWSFKTKSRTVLVYTYLQNRWRYTSLYLPISNK